MPASTTSMSSPSARLATEWFVSRARSPAGHVIAATDIWPRRPGSGEISVQHFDRLVGARLTRAVRRNQQLLWSDLDGVTAQANS